MRIDPDTCRDPVLLSAEVRRLQAVIASGEPTLTEAEREAIAYFAVIDGPQYLLAANEAATTLRVLLERLGATNKTDGYVE